MLNRKNLLSWLPLAVLALVMLTGLRPVVRGAAQRGPLGLNAPSQRSYYEQLLCSFPVEYTTF